jgi:hypothetical protein
MMVSEVRSVAGPIYIEGGDGSSSGLAPGVIGCGEPG